MNDVVYSSGMFGEYSPYYTMINDRATIFEDFSEAVSAMPKTLFDPAPVVSLLNFNYVQGDRTLVQGLSKMPWHSDLLGDGSIIRNSPLPHSYNIMSASEIAERFYDLMSNHIKCILSDHNTIWLTLSGGYDSRIIAGLVKKHASSHHSVKVLNWGVAESRDVQYAKKISNEYGWEYNFLLIGPSSSMDTFNYTVKETGAEVSAIDYNPLEVDQEFLKKINREDVILFAHYGDGIGRGEYSSEHFSKIQPRKISNPYFLFNTKAFNHYRNIVEIDRQLAWSTDKSRDKCAHAELDMHENYMRRMLTKRFKYCQKYDPFADAELARFVYSLSPKCRNNAIYDPLLKRIDPFLHALPWAKTGKSFTGVADENNYLKNQHNKKKDYLLLHGQVVDTLRNGQLCKQNIINQDALKVVLGTWRKEPSLSVLIAKLFGIELLIQQYDLEVPTLRSGVGIKSNIGSRAYCLSKDLMKALKR